MPRKKKIDNQKLLQMAKEGASKKEIMETLNIKTYAQFNAALLNAATDAGMVPEIKSSRGTSAPSAIRRETKVNKRGTIVLPKALVDDLGFQEGDSFEISKSKVGISLRKTAS